MTYALLMERELEGIKVSVGLGKMSHGIALKLCQETLSTRQLCWMMSASLGIRSSIESAVSRDQIKPHPLRTFHVLTKTRESSRMSTQGHPVCLAESINMFRMDEIL